ncbi:hypothetical protein PG999_011522 [Apiospora kogelbergensis]|uniref:Uncharacterized protein n=1 Tax=Apiospora kogelbergensis TaxID=1337665 RepID=A0AAW0QDE8_9PEZI
MITLVPCATSDFASIGGDLNNAGDMAIKDYTREQEGHEITLSSNRFNRFLLTDLLVLKIQAIASASSALPAPGSPKKAGRLMTVGQFMDKARRPAFQARPS